MPRCLLNRRLIAALLLLLTSAGAQAAGVPIPHGTLELISENQSIAPGQQFYLGLHFQLEKDWHIYWVNPGDSGQPPRVAWRLPTGFTAGEMEWPAPRRMGTSSIVDFGYHDEVTLLVPMHAPAGLAAQQPARLIAEVKVLVCREMCIPGKAQVSLALSVKSQPPAPDARTRELFTATRKSLPRPAPAGWKFSAEDAKDSFVLTANIGQQVTQAVFFPLAESQMENAAPQVLQPAPAGFRLTLKKSDRLLKPIDRLKGVLVLSGERAYRIDVPLSTAGVARIDHGIGIQPGLSFEEGQE